MSVIMDNTNRCKQAGLSDKKGGPDWYKPSVRHALSRDTATEAQRSRRDREQATRQARGRRATGGLLGATSPLAPSQSRGPRAPARQHAPESQTLAEASVFGGARPTRYSAGQGKHTDFIKSLYFTNIKWSF